MQRLAIAAAILAATWTAPASGGWYSFSSPNVGCCGRSNGFAHQLHDMTPDQLWAGYCQEKAERRGCRHGRGCGIACGVGMCGACGCGSACGPGRAHCGRLPGPSCCGAGASGCTTGALPANPYAAAPDDEAVVDYGDTDEAVADYGDAEYEDAADEEFAPIPSPPE